MGYAHNYLLAHGRECVIQRTPSVTSRVSLKRVSNSSNPSTREASWQGTILRDAVILSGEVFTVGSDSYLVQNVRRGDDVDSVYAVKCNAEVELKRFTETVDENGNIVQEWVTVGTLPAWGEIVTARLRLEDPGLVDAARYLFQLPKSFGAGVMDRIVYGGKNYQVESVDDIAMEGVVRVQLGVDTR